RLRQFFGSALPQYSTWGVAIATQVPLAHQLGEKVQPRTQPATRQKVATLGHVFSPVRGPSRGGGPPCGARTLRRTARPLRITSPASSTRDGWRMTAS